MEWPWEIVRRRGDERRLSEALVATDMAENGHTDVVPALVAAMMHRPLRPRAAFADAQTALAAIWDEALSRPRWQDRQTTRENARQRLNESRLYRGRFTVDGRGKPSRAHRRLLAELAGAAERGGDHVGAAAIRGLVENPGPGE